MAIVITFALIQTNNSFTMMRLLGQGNNLARISPKFTRNIGVHLTPEERKNFITACKQLEKDCSAALPRNRRALALLVSHTSLVEYISNKNLENLVKLEQENTAGTYDLHNLTPQLEFLNYLQQQQPTHNENE